jgi:hypothetical protein
MTTQVFGKSDQWLAIAAREAANGLHLAAAPTFAVMALVAGANGGGAHDVLCAAMQHASPLAGMPSMYLLMAVFHLAPWLKRLSGRGEIGRS